MSERHRSPLVNLMLCLLFLVAGGAGFAGLASLREDPPRREVEEKVLNVEVYEVQPADLLEIVSGFGTVVAEREVTYSALVAGEVDSVSQRLKVGENVSGPEFIPNDPVTVTPSHQEQGDVLLAIDPEVYHEQLTQADSAIAEVQAELQTLAQEEKNSSRLLATATRNLNTAKADHERMLKLAQDGTVTENQLSFSELELRRYERVFIEQDNLQSLFPARRHQLTKRQERLTVEKKLAAINVRRTEVRPPFSGVLTEVMVEKGQYVQPGTPLFRLTRIEKVEIAVPLHATDFAKIAELVLAGEQPRVELAENEVAKARWTGRVVRISAEADTTTRTMDVFVEVDNRENTVPLLPGTFVQARMRGPVLRNTVVVPRGAVSGGEVESGLVYLARDGCAVGVPVKLSRRLEGQAFISDGLVAGDRVVLTNLDVIGDGSKIETQAVRTVEQELDRERSLSLIPRVSVKPAAVQD